jgi:hypothetical protein
MISSLRNFSVRILDADRFTIVVFQILDIKSNYLPGIVQELQEGKNLTCYSRKLSSAQTCYTTGEQELLNIVETLKKMKILLGQKVIVRTDYLNILYGKLSNDRITR